TIVSEAPHDDVNVEVLVAHATLILEMHSSLPWVLGSYDSRRTASSTPQRHAKASYGTIFITKVCLAGVFAGEFSRGHVLRKHLVVLTKSLKRTREVKNKADWTDFRPEFVNVVADWDCIIESWMRQSKVDADNRKKVPGDVEGTSSYIRHTSGSKSFRSHTHELEKEGKKASKVVEFERLHKRNKGKGVWCDSRLEKIMTTYKESIKAVDDVGLNSSDIIALDSPDCVGLDSPVFGIPFESESWEKVNGGPKKKSFYGHKITQDPEILHGHRTSSDSTPVNNEANIKVQANARVEIRLKDVREEMMAEMRQMFDDQQKAMSCNNRHDQKRFGYGALVACFVVTWCLCTVFKPCLSPLPLLNLRLTMADGLRLIIVTDKTSKPQRPNAEVNEITTPIVCNISKHRSDTCQIAGDIRILGNSSTIFLFSSHIGNGSWTIKPYARKGDISAMEGITNFTIKSIQEAAQDMPKCTKTHNVTAIVFSVGGYAGNNFHAFTDVIIPLYETSRVFDREVKFLVANNRSRWTSKFQEVLGKLSRYKIVDIDQEKEVHCFPSMIVGLKKEEKKELHMETIKDFTDFLRSTYSLKRLTTTKLTNSTTKKPRLLIVSRQKTRTFTNEKDVVRTAQGLGFEVIVTEMNANLRQVSRLVNSCDVMMGVHGAGLTNMVFLPENGVLIQVVPWGKMDWLANTYFKEPSKAIGLKYLEYKINVEESSLIKQYPLNHQVFLDPFSVQKKGWDAYKSTYLDNQNINVNVTRLKKTLSIALELLKL
nr:EGF domain-specific O-linked N-acetylglucosamine transferase-like [Tanacetum cinerariifolium]